MQMDMTTVVDGSLLLAPHSSAPSTTDVDFEAREEVKIVVEGGNDSQFVIPTSLQRYKQTTRRIVKHPTICK